MTQVSHQLLDLYQKKSSRFTAALAIFGILSKICLAVIQLGSFMSFSWDFVDDKTLVRMSHFAVAVQDEGVWSPILHNMAVILMIQLNDILKHHATCAKMNSSIAEIYSYFYGMYCDSIPKVLKPRRVSYSRHYSKYIQKDSV